jgi:hypothetical protein
MQFRWHDSRGAAPAGSALAEAPEPPRPRDPAHVLFDHACDLLAAAQGMRASAGADGVGPALAATLGCLEATLDALAASVEEMGAEAVRRLEDAPRSPDGDALSVVGAERQFAGLVDTLTAGQAMAGSLRERVGAAAAAQRVV